MKAVELIKICEEQPPIADKGVKPGDIKKIDGEYRVAKVGFLKTGSGPDDYETIIRWYLPRTGSEIRTVRNMRGKEEEYVEDTLDDLTAMLQRSKGVIERIKGKITQVDQKSISNTGKQMMKQSYRADLKRIKSDIEDWKKRIRTGDYKGGHSEGD